MKPLAGVRIAVTRPEAQGEELAARLRAVGAEVLLTPLIRIDTVINQPVVRRVIADIGRFDWIVFSSANGVRVFMQAFKATEGDEAQLRGLRVGCVGPATAQAARDAGLPVDLMPTDFTGASLAMSLAAQHAIRGKNVLLARVCGANPDLPARLRAHGAKAVDLELYRSLPDEIGIEKLRSYVAEGAVDVITFTSGSTVHYFAEYIGSLGLAKAAVIGPVTAYAARELGLAIAVEAAPHTSAGLVSAIIEYMAAQGGSQRGA